MKAAGPCELDEQSRQGRGPRLSPSHARLGEKRERRDDPGKQKARRRLCFACRAPVHRKRIRPEGTSSELTKKKRPRSGKGAQGGLVVCLGRRRGSSVSSHPSCTADDSLTRSKRASKPSREGNGLRTLFFALLHMARPVRSSFRVERSLRPEPAGRRRLGQSRVSEQDRAGRAKNAQLVVATAA